VRLDKVLDQRFTDVGDRFATGQVSAVVSNKITVSTTGGASMTIPRLATWTPAIGDLVVIAKTPGGWVALGKIA
jgi:hypothetical protein